MTQKEKLLQKFIERPTSVSFRELEKIIFLQGYSLYEAKGSHKKYKKEGCSDIIIAVHGNDCKNVYKIKAKKVLFPQ